MQAATEGVSRGQCRTCESACAEPSMRLQMSAELEGSLAELLAWPDLDPGFEWPEDLHDLGDPPNPTNTTKRRRL